MVSGVYMITHTPSGRMYIGSSNNINRRWKLHSKALATGQHHSTYLQRAWDKHGAVEFLFTPLIVCAVEDLREYEQRCIDGLQPAFNMSRSARGPVHRGQKLPKQWVDKVAKAVRERYAAGFKVVHPPRSKQYRDLVSVSAQKRWEDPETRIKIVQAMQTSMTAEERAKKSERAKLLWANPLYRERAIASRKGNAYSKGYKCTPEQVANRKRAARISNMKRNYGENWVAEYIRRYPEFSGDVCG